MRNLGGTALCEKVKLFLRSQCFVLVKRDIFRLSLHIWQTKVYSSDNTLFITEPRKGITAFAQLRVVAQFCQTCATFSPLRATSKKVSSNTNVSVI